MKKKLELNFWFESKAKEGRYLIVKALHPIHSGLITLVLVWWCITAAWTQTVRNFDTDTGTKFLTANCVPFNPAAAKPEELPGGPTGVGNFLRLATTSPPSPLATASLSIAPTLAFSAK